MMKLTNKRFQSRILRILFHLLPCRVKRLMFITSLTGKITGKKTLTRFERIRIQERFKLCKDPDAMDLPLAVSDKIWINRPVEQYICQSYLDIHCRESELTRTARQIVAIMPCWLVYASTSKIVDDVKELLKTRSELLAPQPQ